MAVAVPASWSAGEPAEGVPSTALAAWWQRFHDPLLSALVEQSLAANTDVRSAQAVLAQSRALRDVAQAALWPTLGATASAQHATAGGHGSNSVAAGLDAAWAPDVFGGNRDALAAADAVVQASEATLGDVHVQVAAEVGSSYLLLRGSQARWRIATDNLASQRDTLQIAGWRQQAGLATTLDVDQARAAMAQTAALVPAQQVAIAQACHAIAVLTGQPPAALAPLLEPVEPVPSAEEAIVLAIPAETLRQRADVRAAERQVAAAFARVRQADAARLPSFSIGGSIGLGAATIGALTDGASVVSALLAGITLPVFDAGALRAQARVQQAALEQAGAAYDATVLAALKDVEDSLVALRGDRERLARLGDAASAATEADALARQRYESGLVDFQTVLDTQRTRLAAQDGLASAGVDVSSDQVRLFKALGGGWHGDDAVTAPPPSRQLARMANP